MPLVHFTNKRGSDTILTLLKRDEKYPKKNMNFLPKTWVFEKLYKELDESNTSGLPNIYDEIKFVNAWHFWLILYTKVVEKNKCIHINGMLENGLM